MIQRVHLITSGVRLIGIHGKAGAGKDTVGLWLNENYQSVYAQSLAGPLKDAAAAAFGIHRSVFHDPLMKEVTNTYWGVSPRKIAQYLGTEMFRDHIVGLLPDCRSDFWIRRLTGLLNNELTDSGADDYLAYNSDDTVIVPDIRFSNESDWVLENGGHVIWLQRPDLSPVGIPGHASEADISTEGMYDIFNNSTKEYLYDQVDEFARSIGLIPKPKSTFHSSNF